MDEVWLCGPRISNGRLEEIGLSLEYGIPIKCYNCELQPELDVILRQWSS